MLSSTAMGLLHYNVQSHYEYEYIYMYVHVFACICVILNIMCVRECKINKYIH